MAKTNCQSVDDYFEAFGGETLDRLQKLRAIVRDVAPEGEEVISYQIPCYKYKGYLIYYCAFPKHISLSYPFSQAFWEHFKEDIGSRKTSKSVIQFPAGEAFPVELITRMVEFRKRENEASATNKKTK